MMRLRVYLVDSSSHLYTASVIETAVVKGYLRVYKCAPGISSVKHFVAEYAEGQWIGWRVE